MDAGWAWGPRPGARAQGLGCKFQGLEGRGWIKGKAGIHRRARIHRNVNSRLLYISQSSRISMTNRGRWPAGAGGLQRPGAGNLIAADGQRRWRAGPRGRGRSGCPGAWGQPWAGQTATGGAGERPRGGSGVVPCSGHTNGAPPPQPRTIAASSFPLGPKRKRQVSYPGTRARFKPQC